MNILALDTCFRACSAALLRADGKIVSRFQLMERGHAEALLPMVRAVMEEAAMDFSAIDRIAVTVGPGTFTGLRIGVAAARGLALATGAELFGQTSLAVLALGAAERAREPREAILAAAPAGRGHLYFQAFDGEGRPSGEARLLAPGDDVAALQPGEAQHLLLCGGGARALAVAIPPESADKLLIDEHEPEAAALARMAAAGRWPSLPVRPLYLRAPDARPQPDMALARRP